MTMVHAYKLEDVGYFADDMNPGVNIGQMLVSLDPRYGPQMMLCDERHVPMVIKTYNLLYGFVQPSKGSILAEIPTDSYWSRLADEAAISIQPEDIAIFAQTKGLTTDYAAKKLLEENMRRTGKDVGVFLNNKGKLVAFVMDCFPSPEAFVERSSYDYNELIAQSADILNPNKKKSKSIAQHNPRK